MAGISGSMHIKEYIRRKALGMLGLIGTEIDPRTREDRLAFVNDLNLAIENKLHEYNVWYSGDSDELLNFYSRAQSIDWNSDPVYNRNKRSYFWTVAATEQDIKRTHSGQPRNIVDTLVNIVGIPRIRVTGKAMKNVQERLDDILRENHFTRTLTQKARPLTLVEGWGAWKINWDADVSDVPILLYYRAEAVDFVWRSGRLAGIIYRDWYQDENKHDYVLFEIRRREGTSLMIEKELFRMTPSTDLIVPVPLTSLPQLRDVHPRIEITNYRGFLGYPCIVYGDNNEDTPGRSIFTGKLDMFDDLDQCLSQSSNTVRRSTVLEYFDTMYLEKDEKTGMPLMPRSFDRKYVAYRGTRTGDGAIAGTGPVQVTQPALNFEQYSAEAQSLLLQIISGIMSPATLGIDIAKKDNAEAQREKEKVTIFTRNTVIAEEGETLRRIANDLLCADEFMREGKMTCPDYGIVCEYDAFADASFENKLETVLAGWREGLMSDRTAIDFVYGDSWNQDRKDEEIRWIEENREKTAGTDAMAEMGELGAENPHNEDMEAVDMDSLTGEERPSKDDPIPPI